MSVWCDGEFVLGGIVFWVFSVLDLDGGRGCRMGGCGGVVVC